MAHLMLGTFIAACLANVCALLAECLREFTTTGHVCSGEAAYLGAVHVGCYAAGHHLDVLLFQAGRRTKVACVSTGITSFDTRGILLVGHDVLQSISRENALRFSQRRVSFRAGLSAEEPDQGLQSVRSHTLRTWCIAFPACH